MRWKSSGTACVLAVAVAAAVSACGSGVTVSVATLSPTGTSVAPTPASGNRTAVPDAKTVVDGARAAYRKATSAHVHATIQDQGRTQVVDIRGAMDGSNQELTIDDSDSGKATVRTVDGKHYIKGNRDFWQKGAKADATTAALLADKWVLAPNASTSDFQKLTIRHLLDGMIGPGAISDSDTDQMRTYAATEQDTDLFVAVAVDPAAQDVDTLKIVAADPHNVTEVVGTSDDGSDGTADFDGWNTQSQVTVPKGYITVPGSGSTNNPTV